LNQPLPVGVEDFKELAIHSRQKMLCTIPVFLFYQNKFFTRCKNMKPFWSLDPLFQNFWISIEWRHFWRIDRPPMNTQAYGKKCILIDEYDVIVSILRNDFGFMQPEVDKMLETYA